MGGRMVALPETVRAKLDLSSMRSLHVGGAPVHYDLKVKLIELFGPDCLFEGYGSTELQYVTVMEPAEQMRRPGSCGRPYDGVSVRLLSAGGLEVPAGEIGELTVRTPLLFAGYLRNGKPERQGVDDEGYFHTGDLARMDEDGFLYIVGRRSDMIIRGGVNIYPAEVEAALLKHPEIADAAVFGIPDDDLGEIVVACCELHPASIFDEAGLREFCSDKLAKYKVPARFVRCDSFPRNAMNKTIKRELRDQFLRSISSEEKDSP
jgi:long-chain acyl-CoA synthetase